MACRGGSKAGRVGERGGVKDAVSGGFLPCLIPWGAREHELHLGLVPLGSKGTGRSSSVLVCHWLQAAVHGGQNESVTQSCPTLCYPMDCSPPSSSAHGILQARILE